MPSYDQNIRSSLAISKTNNTLKFPEDSNIDYLIIMNQFVIIGTWQLDVVKNNVFWSKEVFIMHGIPWADGPVDLKKALSFYIDADLRSLTLLIQQAIRSVSGFTMQFRIRRSDGKLRVVESHAAPVVDKRGVVTKLVGTFRDITDLASVDNLRTAHQDLVIRMISSMPIAVAMLDRTKKFIAHSNAWKNICNIRNDRVVVGMLFVDICPQLAISLNPLIDLTLRGQPAGKDNVTFAIGADVSITGDCVIQPWFDQEGNIGGAVVMLNCKRKGPLNELLNVVPFNNLSK